MQRKLLSDLDSPRIRFNWGYHDAAMDVREGWKIRDMSAHFDRNYAAGYVEGVKDAREGAYEGNSERAWIRADLGDVQSEFEHRLALQEAKRAARRKIRTGAARRKVRTA